jgi:excisionase family DNA binding protein
MEEKLLTIRDVAIFLGISEKTVIELAESGAIPAYKIGGVYLRFKRHQIEEFRKSSGQLSQGGAKLTKSPAGERLLDFLYFNDFYIVAFVIIAVMLVFIFRG